MALLALSSVLHAFLQGMGQGAWSMALLALSSLLHASYRAWGKVHGAWRSLPLAPCSMLFQEGRVVELEYTADLKSAAPARGD